jgi:hypothetical protein
MARSETHQFRWYNVSEEHPVLMPESWREVKVSQKSNKRKLTDMKLLNKEIKRRIDDSIVESLRRKEYDLAMDSIARVVDDIHDSIPGNKRVSYGIVYAIKTLGDCVDGRLAQAGVSILPAASRMLKASSDAKCRGVALGLLAFHGVDDLGSVLPHFEAAAASSDWATREFAQVFFR